MSEPSGDAADAAPHEAPDAAAPGPAAELPVELEAIAARWAESAAEDLGGLLGKTVRIEPGEVRQATRDELVLGTDPVVHARFRSRNDPELRVHAVTALAHAGRLAAARLGTEPADAPAIGDFRDELLDAFVESMDLCAGVLGRVLAAAAALPAFEHETSAAQALPLAADATLEDGVYRRIRFTLAVEGQSEGNLDLLFAAEQADAWFGPAEETADDWGRPLAVVDPDPERREQVEALAEELGRPVWTLDPAEFSANSLEELAESGAIIVSWDLGGYRGLELLETLLADPRTCDLPVALASGKPTRERVLTALRFGARSFLQQPYEADEIVQRLRNLPR